jgi:hypothetical protein
MKRALTPLRRLSGWLQAVKRRHLPNVAGEERHFYETGCTLIQCRAISSRVATQTLGREAT